MRKPHPSLWIGGGGEKVTLKLVAQYADAANFGDGDTEVIRQKLAVLRQHCDAIGRDYDEIVKSTSLNVFPLESGADPRGRPPTSGCAAAGPGSSSATAW